MIKYTEAKKFWASNAYNLLDLPTISTMFISNNMQDSAIYYLDLEAKISPNWQNCENYHLAKTNYYKSIGKQKMALEEFEKMHNIHNTKVRETLKNNIALTASDFYNTKSEIEKYRANRYNLIIYFLIILFFVISFIFFLFYQLKMKQKKLEIEDKMYEAQHLLNDKNSYLEQLNTMHSKLEKHITSLESIIQNSEYKLNVQSALVNQLFKEQFSILDLLSTEYFEKKDSEKMKTTIIKDFEREIARIKQPDAINRLQSIVNQCRDNILIRIQEQFPKFKESDIWFISLILAGFSPRSICLFTNIKIGNYYNKWTRIKMRIANSESPDKEFFLSSIYGK